MFATLKSRIATLPLWFRLVRARLALNWLRMLSWCALAAWTFLWWAGAWISSAFFSPSAIEFFAAIARDFRMEDGGSQTLNAMAVGALIFACSICFAAIVAGISARKAAVAQLTAPRREALRAAREAYRSASELDELSASTPPANAMRSAKRL
jgi:hypothetical protein